MEEVRLPLKGGSGTAPPKKDREMTCEEHWDRHWQSFFWMFKKLKNDGVSPDIAAQVAERLYTNG